MSNKKVLHISTECYPAAKAGGMADVVGALPKYLNSEGWSPAVITPKYALSWFDQHTFRNIYSGSFEMEGKTTIFDIYKAKKIHFRLTTTVSKYLDSSTEILFI